MKTPVWILCNDRKQWAPGTNVPGAPQNFPAPYFRREITLESPPQKAKAVIAGLGFYELYVNGSKVGDRVLDPCPTLYTRRVLSVEHDVAPYLRKGKNCFGVLLGNGFYNAGTETIWHSELLPWRGFCRFLLNVEDENGFQLLCSNTGWKTTSRGPLVFNEIRNGERYDARLEMNGWNLPGFDDSGWAAAEQSLPPGGVVVPQAQPPCRVKEVVEPAGETRLGNGAEVYDFGFGMSGFITLCVKGEAGAAVTLCHAEMAKPDGDIDNGQVEGLVYKGGFQTDQYILKGEPEGETWTPRFTYHGFRYARAEIEGKARIISLKANRIHTDFGQAGRFESSNPVLNGLQACTLRSYTANYVGVPTDCPHREKQSWSGDANLAMETGLYNFNSESAYVEWLESFAEEQLPSGSVPHVLLTGKSNNHNFNWGGPAWDCAFVMMPWTLYVFRGNRKVLEEHYDNYRKFADFYTAQIPDPESGRIVRLGLGDWCPPKGLEPAPAELTSTAYYFHALELVAKIAALLGRKDDAAYYAGLAGLTRKSFNRAFYKGEGIYANGNMTSTACPVFFGLCEEREKEKCVDRLAGLVRADGARAQFGILGAKFVARVLGDFGYADLLYRLFTQPEYPGWANTLKKGATTLWERWDGSDSRMHIMYGDISACFFRYFAGIRPHEAAPGFRTFSLHPLVPVGLDFISASHESPAGTIVSQWKKDGSKFLFHAEIPGGSIATVTLPDGSSFDAGAGKHDWACPLK